MSEDIISQAKEIRRSINELEVKLDPIGSSDEETKNKLLFAIKQFNQFDADSNQNMMKIYAIQIVNEYSTLAFNDAIVIDEKAIISKHNQVVNAHNKLLKVNDDLKKEITEERNQRLELFKHNKILVDIVDRLTIILRKLGIKVDEGGNPLSS